MEMFTCKDNLKLEIAIFAGGLGSRLKNTESRPKPLVDINGKSLLTRLIKTFNDTNLFSKFHILTCGNSEIFYKILGKEIKNDSFFIYEEPKRSGRVGALKYFLKCNRKVDRFFVCNGDTLFLNLIANNISKSLDKFSIDPIIFLANHDSKRDDYKKIVLDDDLNNYYQNSGLCFFSREWFLKQMIEMPNSLDIDEILFSNKTNVNYSLLETSLLDAGTPDRLSYIRSIIR